jgi:hypothetical protein
MKTTLDRIEKRLQDLIETRTIKLLSGSDHNQLLVHQLVNEMGAHVKQQRDGRMIAPNHFLVGLNPISARDLRSDLQRVASLAEALKTAASEAGFGFNHLPAITIVDLPELNPGQVRVTAEFHTRPLEATQALYKEAGGRPDALPANAFLIVEGGRVYALAHAVVNIGRRPDNHLVINDPRVSRLHAQLRAHSGQFLVFDLGSTGGTFVNDQRIHQSPLYPGDVISLAGVQLVYGQDSHSGEKDPLGGTRPLSQDEQHGSR